MRFNLRSRSKSNKKNKSNKRKLDQKGAGRTFNVPFPKSDGQTFIPESPTYNNAVYIGEPCVGNHCGVAVYPSVANIINTNLGYGNSEMPPGANMQYPVIDRLGNSPNEVLPGVQQYTGTDTNPGPFDIRCVSGGKRKIRRNNNNNKRSKSNRSLKNKNKKYMY